MKKLKKLVVVGLVSVAILTSCGSKKNSLDDYEEKKKTESSEENTENKDKDDKEEKEEKDKKDTPTPTQEPTSNPEDSEQAVIHPKTKNVDVSTIENVYVSESASNGFDFKYINPVDVVSEVSIPDAIIDYTDSDRDYDYVYSKFKNTIESLDGLYSAFYNIDPSMNREKYYDNLAYWMILGRSTTFGYQKWFDIMQENNATCKYLGYKPLHIHYTEDENFGYLVITTLIYVELESDITEKGVYELYTAVGIQDTEPFDDKYTALIDDDYYHSGLNKTKDKKFIFTDQETYYLYDVGVCCQYLNKEQTSLYINKTESLLNFTDYYKKMLKNKE